MEFVLLLRFHASTAQPVQRNIHTLYIDNFDYGELAQNAQFAQCFISSIYLEIVLNKILLSYPIFKHNEV